MKIDISWKKWSAPPWVAAAVALAVFAGAPQQVAAQDCIIDVVPDTFGPDPLFEGDTVPTEMSVSVAVLQGSFVAVSVPGVFQEVSFGPDGLDMPSSAADITVGPTCFEADGTTPVTVANVFNGGPGASVFSVEFTNPLFFDSAADPGCTISWDIGIPVPTPVTPPATTFIGTEVGVAESRIAPGNQTVCITSTGQQITNDETEPVIYEVDECSITLEKQISIDGGATFLDADSAGTAPTAVFPADALYRLIVENTGTTDFLDLIINDSELGIVDQSVGPLPAGDTAIVTDGEIPALFVQNRCDGRGTFANTSDADGLCRDDPAVVVTASDPAFLECVGEPNIAIVKEISIDGGVTFFDANDEASAPTPFPPFPSDALYRLTVTNTGTAPLVDVVVNDPTLGIVDFLVGALAVGQTVVLTDGDIPELFVQERCDSRGTFMNTASTSGTSADPPFAVVNDSDPATLVCVGTPDIMIVKEISVDGGATFFDANDVGSAPVVLVPSPALYRVTVTNIGSAPLENVVVNDPELGIVDFPVGDLAVGETVVLTSGDIPELDVATRCDSFGTFINTASTSGASVETGEVVNDSDPATLVCETEPDIEILKEISVDGGATFFDANDAASAPTVVFPSDALYRVTVTNTGTADLTNVMVNDATLGIVDFPVGDLAIGQTVVLTEGEIPELFVADRCTNEGTFMNTASTSGDSVDTGESVNDSDPATLVCIPPGGCLTRTPGFWGTHPHVTIDFLPVTVCGLPIDNTLADNPSSSAEAMCISNRDAKPNGLKMPQLQLIRHLTAAKLNIAATLAAPEPGSCSTFEFDGEVIDTLALIDDCEANYCGASAQDISNSGCLEKLDAFNNSEDTLDPFGEFLSPGPAQPAECSEANGNGVIVE